MKTLSDRWSNIGRSLLLVPFAVVFFAFQIVPMIWVLINSFWVEEDVEWGLTNYTELIGDAFYAQAFTNSLWLSFGSLCGTTDCFFCCSQSPKGSRDFA